MPRNTIDKRKRQYQEINEYRDLLQAPDRFESGFTAKTIVGVLFIAFIMTPGQMYLSLVTGIGIGEAAQWVTVILFLEIAKRSFTTLRRQEIFLLTYVASQLIVRAETGTFLQLIWRQYFVGSQEAVRFGLQQKLVDLKFMEYGWFSPSPDSEAIVELGPGRSGAQPRHAGRCGSDRRPDPGAGAAGRPRLRCCA